MAWIAKIKRITNTNLLMRNSISGIKSVAVEVKRAKYHKNFKVIH